MKKLGELFVGFVLTAFVLLTTAWVSDCALSIIERLTVDFSFAVGQLVQFGLWVAITLMVLMLIVWGCNEVESRISNRK